MSGSGNGAVLLCGFSSLDAYKEHGVEKYKFVATMDAGTCAVCGGLDGQVFLVEDFEVGVNAPPMHPNDRCTTAPYFGELKGQDGDGMMEKDGAEKVGKALQEKGLTTREDLNNFIEKYKKSSEYLELTNTQRKAFDRKLQALQKGNVAIAEVDILGLKSEYKAHSQIHSNDSIGSSAGNFSFTASPEKRIFESYVEDVFPRYNDTEAKILENIASKINSPNTKGFINLYSELDCCQSCSNIIFEFRRRYPNIRLAIYTNSTINH